MKRYSFLFVLFSFFLNGCFTLGLLHPGPFEVELCTNQSILYYKDQIGIDHEVMIFVDGKEVLNKVFHSWDDHGCSNLFLSRGDHHIVAVSKSAGIRYETDISVTEDIAVVLTLNVNEQGKASFNLKIFEGKVVFA